MKHDITKSSIEKSAKTQRRSIALKSMLQTQNSNAPDHQKTSTPTICDIQEDLIDDVSPTVNSSNKTPITPPHIDKELKDADDGVQSAQTLPQSMDLLHSLIDKELSKAASSLGIEEIALKTWIDLHIEVPARVILILLRMIQRLSLDPLAREIGFSRYDDGEWYAFITIEGCSKLLNHHPQFSGLVFHQASALIDGIPEWIECSIYRKDRVAPITVREYYIEVRDESAIWQKMPRRILRHRALQQCVRLAIG